MRVALALIGSRGDVQPGLVLAGALRERGHDVRVGVAPNLVGFAQRWGLPARAVGIDSAAVLASDLVRSRLHARDPRVRVRAAREVSTIGWDELRVGALDLAADADLLVTGLLGQEVGSAVAEATGTAFAALHYCPVRAAGSVPWLAVAPDRPPVQRGLARTGERLRWALTRDAENAQRRALGLPATPLELPRRLDLRGAREIQCYDPVLVPGPAREWGARRPFTGYLVPSAADRRRLGETPDPDLTDWLAGGEPPVYVGFGSMPVADPGALLAAVVAAGDAHGRRVLLAGGWNDVAGLPEVDPRRVRVVAAVDHEQVLPHCAAAVHHGGAGTTGAALRAGIPSVVAAYSADQPIWGRLVARAGVGVATRAARIDGPHLTALLGRALDPGIRARARALSTRLRTPQEALDATVEAIELSC